MTDPAIPTTAALEAIYVAANPVTGDQFVIYAPSPHSDETMFTVSHVTGNATRLAAPHIQLVHPNHIAALASAAVRRMRADHAGHAVEVWLNCAPGTLRDRLPR